MDFRTVAETMRRFFEDRATPFAVIGGFGLHAYGLSRTTYDLDLLVDASSQDELIRYLEEELGYQTLHRSAGYSNHLHRDPAWGRLDFVYIRGETSRKLFAELRTAEVLAGVELPVPRPEHLAALKIHAMKNDPARRHRELADLRFLLGLPQIDRAAVRAELDKRGLGEAYDDLVDD